jgi:hypothetical protein
MKYYFYSRFGPDFIFGRGISIRVAIEIPLRKNSAEETQNGFRYSQEKRAPFAEFFVSRNRFRTKFIPRKKVFWKVVRVLFFVLEWFGTSFQQFFLSLNGSECFFLLRMGTEFGAFLSSSEWFGTKLRSSECFSL